MLFVVWTLEKHFLQKKPQNPHKPENLRTKQLIVMKRCDNQTTRAEKMFRRDIWLTMLARFWLIFFQSFCSLNITSLSVPSLFHKPICLHLLIQPSVTTELFISQMNVDDDLFYSLQPS